MITYCAKGTLEKTSTTIFARSKADERRFVSLESELVERPQRLSSMRGVQVILRLVPAESSSYGRLGETMMVIGNWGIVLLPMRGYATIVRGQTSF